MTETVFESADTVVGVDGTGRVRRVTHRARPADSYLGLGLPRTTRLVDDRRIDLELARTGLAVDADEHELTLDAPGVVAITVRHTFVAGWQTRCVLASLSAEPITLRAWLPCDVPDSAVGWAVADGADAALFVQPADGRGPLLVGRLRQGAVAGIDEDGMRLPEVVLQPGSRYVLAWEWSWLPEPSAYARTWPTLHPIVATVVRGAAVPVLAGPDVAVVIPDGVGLERDVDVYELRSDEPRTADIELRSARGLRRLRLAWTPRGAELLAEAAGSQLDRPRGPVGVVRLPDLDAAIVVQHARRAELLDTPEEAEDTLDLFTARFDPEHPEPALSGLFLCGEYERTGDPDLLQLASDQVLRTTGPEPGLGFAATRICAALVAANSSPQPVMEHVITVAGELSSRIGAADLASLAELLVITHRTRPDRCPPDAEDPLLRSVLALGTRLGSGLPGAPVRPLPTAGLGHLLATFAALPDSLAEPTGRAWGVPAADLAARLTPTLIARLVAEPLGRGHVWLAIIASAG